MSTTLQYSLVKSTEITCRVKTNFFSLQHSEYEKGPEHYASQFSDRFSPKSGNVLVESDEHLIVPKVDEDWLVNLATISDIERVSFRIKHTLFYPKVIVVYRRQAEMYLSKYIQFVRGGGSAKPENFYDWLLEENVDTSGYDYAMVAQLLFDVFGKENVLMLPSESFLRHFDHGMCRVANFIGVESLPLVRKANVSPSASSILLQRWLNSQLVIRKQSIHDRAQTRGVPVSLWKVLRRGNEAVDRWVGRPKRRDALMPESYKHIIMKKFRQSNMAADRILNDKLSKLGYY
jgi:hypothetical protein